MNPFSFRPMLRYQTVPVTARTCQTKFENRFPGG